LKKKPSLSKSFVVWKLNMLEKVVVFVMKPPKDEFAQIWLSTLIGKIST
jgi:hypothetical protein